MSDMNVRDGWDWTGLLRDIGITFLPAYKGNKTVHDKT